MKREYQKQFVYDAIAEACNMIYGDTAVIINDRQIETILQMLYPNVSITGVYYNLLNCVACDLASDELECVVNKLEDDGVL